MRRAADSPACHAQVQGVLAGPQRDKGPLPLAAGCPPMEGAALPPELVPAAEPFGEAVPFVDAEPDVALDARPLAAELLLPGGLAALQGLAALT